MRGLVLGIAIGLSLAFVIVACGAAPQKQPNGRYEAISQITALWTQIRDWRLEAGMRVDPAPETLFAVKGRPVRDAKLVCPDTHPITQQCDDICSLADAICDNAEAICDIANKLGKDDHQAQDKCTSATASCKEAKQRCCAKCSEQPKQVEPPKEPPKEPKK